MLCTRETCLGVQCTRLPPDARQTAGSQARDQCTRKVLSREDDKLPSSGIAVQAQARRGKPFDQSVDRYLAIDESGKVDRRLQRRYGATPPPWDDGRSHAASSARSA